MDEFERIERLKELLRSEHDAVAVGIGDDAAVLRQHNSARVWTVDACVEGVHFVREYASWTQIAGRAFVAAVSDVYAMGGAPVAALTALTLPAGSDDAFEGISVGLTQASERVGAPIIGGNITSGEAVSITTTVLGDARNPVLRSGARPGDSLYVTGNVGGAALGLAALRGGAGDDSRFAAFVQQWRKPPFRKEEGARLGEIASAAIDISDGLAQDLTHLANASGVEIEVELAAIPVPARFREACTELGVGIEETMLGGGDDYELLFTTSEMLEAPWATRIGVVNAGTGLRWVDLEGNSVTQSVAGYVHKG